MEKEYIQITSGRGPAECCRVVVLVMNKIVEQAKKLLMQKYGITEPEAHRALQQYAMHHGLKMAEYAAEIVKSSMEE